MWSRTFKYNESTVKYWVATHIKHHAYPDTHDDPHSPYFFKIKYLILQGRVRLTEEDATQFSKNYQSQRTRLDDFFEKYSYGPYVMFVLLLMLFGYWGVLAWCSLMLTAYYSAVGNIMFHAVSGYRNDKALRPSDRSRNIFPIGIVMGGEELHGNHHRWPNRANFAVRNWEFDIGYWILWLLEKLKLVTIIAKENGKIKELTAKKYR